MRASPLLCFSAYLVVFAGAAAAVLGFGRCNPDMVALVPTPATQFFWFKFPVDTGCFRYFSILDSRKRSLFCLYVTL